MLAPHERINDAFDACYVPRTFHLTGELDLHDIGVDADDRPIFVATRFNCLGVLSPKHSFKPVGSPPFITGLFDGDKCHLNGLEMLRGKPAYATAVSRSDVIDGWRDRRADGGVVIDVQASASVCEGLSIPIRPACIAANSGFSIREPANSASSTVSAWAGAASSREAFVRAF